ncbi:MBL fold metallo-hydrolase [Halocatena pleomorpha]|uniref:MBL fold metallo-hydrolase n=1 Tax=Halocatena pleomorpha TaxID=1785090 RepID=A0A3P3RAP7_9EURY|nr:MBL fold metallo-hydrolase [Halocatena pleomorpha]RRJ30562.1 MBL fold metallo-hydrolase [Halocatena pleomorpha]
MTEITNLARGVQGFTSNAFLLPGERTVVVDPGNEFDAPARIRDHVPDIDAVVLTHTHPDHVGNLSEVKSSFGVSAWGFDTEQTGVDNAIDDGERVQLGDHTYTALHTPGHKNDHLCLYAADPGILFAGDLVFAGGSFGRTDLDEGDREQLVRSIDRVLDTTDSSLSEMHTGHGQSVRSDPYRHIELARQAAEMY